MSGSLTQAQIKWFQSETAVAVYGNNNAEMNVSGLKLLFRSTDVIGNNFSETGYASAVYWHEETNTYFWAQRGSQAPYQDLADWTQNNVHLAGLADGVPTQFASVDMMAAFLAANGIAISSIYHSGHSLGHADASYALIKYGGISELGLAGAGIGNVVDAANLTITAEAED